MNATASACLRPPASETHPMHTTDHHASTPEASPATGSIGRGRRDFMKASGLSMLGLALAGRAAWPDPVGAEALASVGYPASGFLIAGYVVDGLTAIAVTDDTMHLARFAPSISPIFKQSLMATAERPAPGNIALSGGVLPATEEQGLRFIYRLQQDWKGWRNGNKQDQQLALLLGWTMHRAVRLQLAPLYATFPDPDEARVYHDAAVVRLRSGAREGQASSEEVFEMLNAMVPRTMIRFHTNIPDYDDAEGWIMRVANWRVNHARLLQRYADAIASPDPARQNRYVTQPNFVNPADPLIQLAARLRDGGRNADNLEGALAEAGGQSLYAQALLRSFRHLEAASAYFDREIDAGTLRSHWEIV
jgi:hypothetical protein